MCSRSADFPLPTLQLARGSMCKFSKKHSTCDRGKDGDAESKGRLLLFQSINFQNMRITEILAGCWPIIMAVRRHQPMTTQLHLLSRAASTDLFLCCHLLVILLASWINSSLLFTHKHVIPKPPKKNQSPGYVIQRKSKMVYLPIWISSHYWIKQKMHTLAHMQRWPTTRLMDESEYLVLNYNYAPAEDFKFSLIYPYFVCALDLRTRGHLAVFGFPPWYTPPPPLKSMASTFNLFSAASGG